jgi:hypothetical protein
MGLSGAAQNIDHRISRRISTVEESLHPRIAIAILFLTFPMAALADLNETTILETNSALNLDTGAVVGSGGDILWNGSTLAPQGSAKARNLGKIGAVNFGLMPQSTITSDAAGAKSTPIAADNRGGRCVRGSHKRGGVCESSDYWE